MPLRVTLLSTLADCPSLSHNHLEPHHAAVCCLLVPPRDLSRDLAKMRGERRRKARKIQRNAHLRFISVTHPLSQSDDRRTMTKRQFASAPVLTKDNHRCECSSQNNDAMHGGGMSQRTNGKRAQNLRLSHKVQPSNKAKHRTKHEVFLSTVAGPVVDIRGILITWCDSLCPNHNKNAFSFLLHTTSKK